MIASPASCPPDLISLSFGFASSVAALVPSVEAVAAVLSAEAASPEAALPVESVVSAVLLSAAAAEALSVVVETADVESVFALAFPVLAVSLPPVAAVEAVPSVVVVVAVELAAVLAATSVVVD